jgi:UDP-N-acetylmuramoyl-tripeptide--D-alanyl-D-alanine ligase
VVGITGSAGKTTTKEMIARVLATRYHVLKTEGNLNNHFGLPLTLLRLTPAHDVAVLEMGMNHAGEITRLAQIAAPQIGVVTNVGAVHLGFFASVDAIAAAKRELIEALPQNGVAVLNADDFRVRRFSEHFRGRTLYFGTLQESDSAAPGVYVSDLHLQASSGSEFYASLSGGKPEGQRREAVKVNLPLLGRHNVLNAAAAMAAGTIFGVDLRRSAEALGEMVPAGSRGQVHHVNDMTVIDDTYNSNPPALENMLSVLMNMPGSRHILVAGEMLELGEATAELHRQAGTAIARSGVDALFAVRGAAAQMLEGAHAAGFKGPAYFFDSAEQCAPELRKFVKPGDVVLAKASRGVALEKALTGILRTESAASH